MIFCCFTRNNNTIENETFDISEISIAEPPLELCQMGAPSCANHICANCTTVADSPQSIISEESLSQDSLVFKHDRRSSRSNSISSLHSLDSRTSDKPLSDATVVNEEPPTCRWLNCSQPHVDSDKLQTHIENEHIQEQQDKGSKYSCQWDGCRCFDKTSSSRTWLERHVLLPTGDQPFQCIFQDCPLRFPSQNLLERHVRNHFTYQEQIEQARSRHGVPTKNKKKKLKRKLVRPGRLLFICLKNLSLCQSVAEMLLVLHGTFFVVTLVFVITFSNWLEVSVYCCDLMNKYTFVFSFSENGGFFRRTRHGRYSTGALRCTCFDFT